MSETYRLSVESIGDVWSQEDGRWISGGTLPEVLDLNYGREADDGIGVERWAIGHVHS